MSDGRAESIFHAARSAPPAQREGYLKGACRGDDVLRARVEALLRADAEAGSFMAQGGGGTGGAGVGNFRISPDGTMVAVINGSGRGVNIVSIDTAEGLYALPDDGGSVWWLAWSPDSRRVAVSRSEGDISIWNLDAAAALAEAAGVATRQPVGAPSPGG